MNNPAPLSSEVLDRLIDRLARVESQLGDLYNRDPGAGIISTGGNPLTGYGGKAYSVSVASGGSANICTITLSSEVASGVLLIALAHKTTLLHYSGLWSAHWGYTLKSTAKIGEVSQGFLPTPTVDLTISNLNPYTITPTVSQTNGGSTTITMYCVVNILGLANGVTASFS